jgi:predicted nuclease with RNAse H fold
MPAGASDLLIDTLIAGIRSAYRQPACIGIDLTGSERRASGICVLRERGATLSIARTDEEILGAIDAAGIDLVSLDSSLGLPAGRCCADDACGCRKYGIMRECERILRRCGIRVYPTLIKSMQSLTMRGIRLAGILREQGYEVIESYPGGTQDVLQIPRKKTDIARLRAGLAGTGVRIHAREQRVTHDELDALTSALVGYFYRAGWYEAIGNATEGYLILPNTAGLPNR